MGAEFDFYKVEVNSTHLWMDKSYSFKHYTHYCIWVTSPDDVQLTVNTWFATKDSSARLTIISPSVTDINLSFHSPNLKTASVSGAVSSSWDPDSKTLSFVVNTSTSTTFTISVTVTETGVENTNPENCEFIGISNMEGCGDWLFAEEQYYSFKAKYWDGDGVSDLVTVKIAFTDGRNWINVSYDVSAETFSLDSGNDVTTLKAGIVTSATNLITVIFDLYLKSGILDALDVDIWMYCNDTSGAEDGWEIMAEDYFNIYNLGGMATLETSGTAGRTTGGDVFELYAEQSSWIRSNVTFRKLQHVHAMLHLSVEPFGQTSHTAWTDDDYWSFGIDYCYNDEWIQGWEARLYPKTVKSMDPLVGGGGIFVKLNVTWFYQGENIKDDLIYIFWEGFKSDHDVFTVWVDLWFNKVNASTTIGGRVNGEYFGVNNANFLIWQSDWHPMIGNVTQSMFFTDLKDREGNIISCKQVEMMHLWSKVSRSSAYEAITMDICEIDIFNILTTTEGMVGIDTPIFVSTKEIEMPSTGFLQPLWTAIKNLGSVIGHAITTGALAMWTTFVGFLDTLFTWAGWPNGFSQITGWITQLITWLGTGISYMASLIGSTFTLMASYLPAAITNFVNIVIGFVSIFSYLTWMWNYAGVGVSNISELIIPFLPLLPLAVFIWIFSARDIEGMIKRVTMLWNLLRTGIGFFIQLAEFTIGLVHKLIEAIPIAE